MKRFPRGTKLRFFVFTGMLILLGGIMMFGFFGCGKAAYTVDYRGQKDDYLHARETYKAGAHVKLIYYMIGTDTDYSFYLDGEKLHPHYKKGKGFVLTFTMPAHDVQLECRAVNSMVRSADGDDALEGDMLVDLYTETVATDGGDGYTEMTLYAYTTNQVKLVVYRKDDPEAEESGTTYLVPYAAYSRCREAIERADMRAWNDSTEPLDGEEGAVTVCRFLETDGTYVRVTSEAMPPDGAAAFAALREILQSYVSPTYQKSSVSE